MAKDISVKEEEGVSREAVDIYMEKAPREKVVDWERVSSEEATREEEVRCGRWGRVYSEEVGLREDVGWRRRPSEAVGMERVARKDVAGWEGISREEGTRKKELGRGRRFRVRGSRIRVSSEEVGWRQASRVVASRKEELGRGPRSREQVSSEEVSWRQASRVETTSNEELGWVQGSSDAEIYIRGHPRK